MVKIRPDRACWWLLRSIYINLQVYQVYPSKLFRNRKGPQKNMPNKSKSRPTNQANIQKKQQNPAKHRRNITKTSPKTHDPKNPGQIKDCPKESPKNQQLPCEIDIPPH